MRSLIVIFSLLLLVTACSQNDSKQQYNDSGDVLPEGVSVKNSHINMNKDDHYSDEERAQHLANLATSIPDVHGATAIVLGNVAVVGIDVDANIERSEVGTIKYSVTESLKHDPLGVGAVVVADPDLNARLKEIRQDIDAGKPLQGIMNELADVVGRIIPDVPPQDNQEDPEDAPNKPKDQMNQQMEKDLDDKQEEQANDKNL